MAKIGYCVVATKRDCGYNRVMITGGMSENAAYEKSAEFQKDRDVKRMYKYFKVAKYPYREIK